MIDSNGYPTAAHCGDGCGSLVDSPRKRGVCQLFRAASEIDRATVLAERNSDTPSCAATGSRHDGNRLTLLPHCSLLPPITTEPARTNTLYRAGAEGSLSSPESSGRADWICAAMADK